MRHGKTTLSKIYLFRDRLCVSFYLGHVSTEESFLGIKTLIRKEAFT